jgi:hypothetical protein
MTNLYADLLWSLLPWAFVMLWLLWAAYVLTMGLYRAHLSGRLTGINRVLALPLVLLAVVLDLVVNCTIAALLFADWPQEALVTQRLQRYIAQGAGWRCKAAQWICQNLLDPFDAKGVHCKP